MRERKRERQIERDKERERVRERVSWYKESEHRCVTIKRRVWWIQREEKIAKMRKCYRGRGGRDKENE